MGCLIYLSPLILHPLTDRSFHLLLYMVVTFVFPQYLCTFLCNTESFLCRFTSFVLSHSLLHHSSSRSVASSSITSLFTSHTPYFVALWSGQGLLRRPWPGGPACFLTILTILITVTIQLSMPMLLKFSSPQIEQHLVLIVAS